MRADETAEEGGARRMRRLAAAAGVLAALVVLDAFWLEPRRLLLRDEVRLDLGVAPLRLVHLADLHVERESVVERRLLAAVAAERPDAILLSGDLVADDEDPRRLARHTRAAAAVVAQLRRLAPVFGVQGHSEYPGAVVAWLEEAGVEFLSNEGRWIGGSSIGGPSITDSADGVPPALEREAGAASPGPVPATAAPPRRARGFLLLGLNQQVGRDRFVGEPEPPFTPVEVDGEVAFGRAESGVGNAYFHYDPSPGAVAGAPPGGPGGDPLAWSGYELEVELRLGGARAEGGVAVHSRYPAGEDRMIALARGGSWRSFVLTPHGTAFTSADTETGVVPEARRWYRVRLRTEVDGGSVRAYARFWPADEPEPEGWQARAEDFSRRQVRAGTVALWARGGKVAFRRLRVTAGDGRVLLEEPLDRPQPPSGWRFGTRGSRLDLALARSLQVPPGTPRVVLTHVPDPVLEASHRGIEAVLAGHTHGGQVRLPGGLALTTRSPLGPYYDRGVFDFAAPNRRGWTRLYINSGVGTSMLPVRFFCPPLYAVVEVD